MVCNYALLAGTTSELKSTLPRVQNAATKLITKSKKPDHVTPLLYNLHWLLVEDCTIFKIIFSHIHITNVGTLYVKGLLSFYQPPLNLRSSDNSLTLNIPRTNLVTYGDRAFNFIAALE